jgi:hypothetical protein
MITKIKYFETDMVERTTHEKSEKEESIGD